MLRHFILYIFILIYHFRYPYIYISVRNIRKFENQIILTANYEIQDTASLLEIHLFTWKHFLLLCTNIHTNKSRKRTMAFFASLWLLFWQP